MQYGGIKVQPIKITSFQAKDTIKAAAKAKGFDMYNEIQDLDLIAKEFKMHEHCRKAFIKGFGGKGRAKKQSEEAEVSYSTSLVNIVLIRP